MNGWDKKGGDLHSENMLPFCFQRLQQAVAGCPSSWSSCLVLTAFCAVPVVMCSSGAVEVRSSALEAIAVSVYWR